MSSGTRTTFETRNRVLMFDGDKETLLCRNPAANKNIWIKKLEGISSIEGVIEDDERFYLACASGERSGCQLAVDKATGATQWYIPGRPAFQVLHGSFLYLIFPDEKSTFYLIKVDRLSGEKIWHHRVDEDLCEYRIGTERIILAYESGKTETISSLTGDLISTGRRKESC